MILNKIKNSAAYRTIVLGESSNRDEHTEISRQLADLATLPSFSIGALLAVTIDGRFGFICFLPFFIWMGEHWSTCDNDIRYGKYSDYGRKMLWSQYSKHIPRHRHPLSHSLIPGSIYRIIYGYSPIWMLVLMSGHWIEFLPLFAVMLTGQMINDVGHLSADRLRPWEWMFGRYTKKELGRNS
jgi:hypothetical protein